MNLKKKKNPWPFQNVLKNTSSFHVMKWREGNPSVPTFPNEVSFSFLFQKASLLYSAWYVGITQKWTAVALESFLGHPWRGEGKSSQCGTSSSAPSCSLGLEGEMAICVIIYRFIGCSWWFGWVVRDWERTWWENWWQGGLWIDLSEWAKTWRHLCSMWMNAPKAYLSREGF